MKIDILKSNDLDPDKQGQVFELFKQLGGDRKQMDLTEVLSGTNPITFAHCTENDKIIGIALMCNYTVISGCKGWIEDVVVDSAYRGKGIGRKLMNALIEVGKDMGLSEILLFTGKHRTAAMHLYTELGFQKKSSQLYYLIV